MSCRVTVTRDTLQLLQYCRSLSTTTTSYLLLKYHVKAGGGRTGGGGAVGRVAPVRGGEGGVAGGGGGPWRGATSGTRPQGGEPAAAARYLAHQGGVGARCAQGAGGGWLGEGAVGHGTVGKASSVLGMLVGDLRGRRKKSTKQAKHAESICWT